MFSSGALRSGKRKKKRQWNANIFLTAGETHEAPLLAFFPFCRILATAVICPRRLLSLFVTLMVLSTTYSYPSHLFSRSFFVIRKDRSKGLGEWWWPRAK